MIYYRLLRDNKETGPYSEEEISSEENDSKPIQQQKEGGDGSRKHSFVENVRETIGKKVAGKNYSRILRLLALICGFAISFSGFMNFFGGHVAYTILSINLMALGLITVVILLPFPKKWNENAKKWFPFLQTWRGRGFYLIFLGSICLSLSTVLPILIGICCILIGLVHLILTFWYRDTLDPTNIVDRTQVQSQNIGMDGFNLKKEILTVAMDNKETIAQTMYENRETIGTVVKSGVEYSNQ